MHYCNVVNNEILTAPRPLPTDIALDNAIAMGWYPAVFLNLPHELECNTLTQIIEMKMALKGQLVECFYEVVNKTDDMVEQTRQLLLATIREERGWKLLRTDWTQLPNAAGLTSEQKAAWETYRQALRDFPNTADLSNIQWPAEPI